MVLRDLQLSICLLSYFRHKKYKRCELYPGFLSFLKRTNSAIVIKFLWAINILWMPEVSQKKNKWCEVSPAFPGYKMLWCPQNTHPKRTNGANCSRIFPR